MKHRWSEMELNWGLLYRLSARPADKSMNYHSTFYMNMPLLSEQNELGKHREG